MSKTQGITNLEWNFPLQTSLLLLFIGVKRYFRHTVSLLYFIFNNYFFYSKAANELVKKDMMKHITSFSACIDFPRDLFSLCL